MQLLGELHPWQRQNVGLQIVDFLSERVSDRNRMVYNAVHDRLQQEAGIALLANDREVVCQSLHDRVHNRSARDLEEGDECPVREQEHGDLFHKSFKGVWTAFTNGVLVSEMVDLFEGYSLAEHLWVDPDWTLKGVYLLESPVLIDLHQGEEGAGDVRVFWIDVDLCSLGDVQEILDCKMVQICATGQD